MANTHDVRIWARENGYPDLTNSGPLPEEIRQKYAAYEANQPNELTADATGEERAPQVKRPTATDRIREGLTRPKKTAASGRTRKTAAKPSHPRVSISGILSTVWDGIAAAVKVVSPPTGYIMEFQAPVAGDILEDSVKGTMVDRVLQPVARLEDQAKNGYALFGPPLMTIMLQARPDMASFIIPRLRNSLMSWMDVAGPKITKLRERNETFEKMYGEDVDKIIDGLMAYFVQDATDPEKTL